jgi:hypothetical protein
MSKNEGYDAAWEEIEIEDPNIAGYLMFLGYKVEAFKKSGSRVSFRVSGNKATEALSYFYKEQEVSVPFLIRCLKTVRSMMFQEKHGGKTIPAQAE